MNTSTRRIIPSDESQQNCRRSLAAILAIPIGMILLLAILLLNLRLTVLSRGYLIGFPERAKIYDRLPTIVIDLLIESELAQLRDPELVNEFEETFGREALEKFAEALIPPIWLEEQVRFNVVEFFDWLEGKRPYPYMRIDMGQLGANAVSEDVREALMELLHQLPVCGPDEFFYRGEFPRCRPAGAELEAYVDEALVGLRESFTETPLLEEDFRTIHSEDVEIIQTVYKAFVWSSWCTWAAALMLILLVATIGGRSLDEILLWSGGLLFIIGAICILILLISYVAIPFRINQLFAEASPDPYTPDHVINFTESLFIGFVRDIIGRWLLIDGVITVFGAMGLFSGIMLRRLRGL